MKVKIRHPQVAQQYSAVGVRIGAHPSFALRRQIGQFRIETAVLIEEFLGLIAFHPAFQLRDMIGMLCIDQERHLVRSEGALTFQAIDLFRSRPPFGGPQDDHWPAWPNRCPCCSAHSPGFPGCPR